MSASIRDRVLARSDLDTLRALRDLDGLAAALNAEGLMEVRQRFITARVVRTLPNGKEILSALKNARSLDIDIDLAYTFLMQEAGLDIGSETTFKSIDALVTSTVFQPDWATQIKSLALFPVVVDRLEVEDALYNRHDASEKQ